MSERNYFVLRDDNCRFPSMTKEQILAAITQAVESGEIKDVDTGFVQTIKTINGKSLKFFVGTQYEYEALTDEDKKDLFAIITNYTIKDGLLQAIEDIKNGNTPVAEAIHALNADNAETATRATLATNASYAGSADYAQRAETVAMGSLQKTSDGEYSIESTDPDWTYAGLYVCQVRNSNYSLALCTVPLLILDDTKDVAVPCAYYKDDGSYEIKGGIRYYSDTKVISTTDSRLEIVGVYYIKVW